MSIHTSIFSDVSKGTLGIITEPLYDGLSDEELRSLLEQTLHTNKLLAIENVVFERYLERHDPATLQSMMQILESARHARKVSSQIASSIPSFTSSGAVQSASYGKVSSGLSYGSSRNTFGSRRERTNPKALKITLAHRIEMVNREIEEMKKALVEAEAAAKKKKTRLLAQIEEMEIRIKETEEAKRDFEEFVSQRGVDPNTGKVSAEKFVKYIEERTKAADASLEKLRLKKSTLKNQIKKVRQQLMEKEELGDVLKPIDFEELEIANAENVKKIEEQNQCILEMKRMTGHRTMKLAKQKRRISEQLAKLSDLEKSVAQKKSQIEKLKSDKAMTTVEIENIESKLESTNALIEEYTAPDVLDFLKLQGELRELKKIHSHLERKKALKEIGLKDRNLKLNNKEEKLVNKCPVKQEDDQQINEQSKNK